MISPVSNRKLTGSEPDMLAVIDLVTFEQPSVIVEVVLPEMNRKTTSLAYQSDKNGKISNLLEINGIWVLALPQKSRMQFFTKFL